MINTLLNSFQWMVVICILFRRTVHMGWEWTRAVCLVHLRRSVGDHHPVLSVSYAFSYVKISRILPNSLELPTPTPDVP